MLTASQLTLTDVTVRYPERAVLENVSLTVRPGETVGVIGENGSGKSTLLKLMAGQARPDHGEIVVVAPGGIGYLPQALEFPASATVADVIDLILADIRALERELRRAEGELGEPGTLAARLDAYAELSARFEARGGYAADSRVDAALAGLGLPRLDRNRPVATLSGGQRSRLALAATLAAEPELLLLDEPTNDLDDQAVAWLERRLRDHRGTIVAVTHDRVFLERVTSTILELDAGAATRHGDGYTGYLRAKAAERQRRQQQYTEWKAELARNQRLAESNVRRLEAIPRKLPLAVFAAGPFRARGRDHGAMSRIRNAKERVARLTADPIAPPAEPLRFEVAIASGAGAPESLSGNESGVRPEPVAESTSICGGARPMPAAESPGPDGRTRPEPTGSPDTGSGTRLAGAAELPGTGVRPDPVAELADIVVAQRLRLAGLRLGVGERLLVTGANGAGKSTLLGVLAGEIRPDAGSVRVRGRVGLLRQHAGRWAADTTLLQAFSAGRAGYADEHAENLLALGLFHPRDLGKRMGELSYGQRRRVEVARLVTEPSEVLLLDEPTNHLSPALVEELEQALLDYPGAVVIVTHDRRMRQRFQGSRLELPERGGPVARAA
ncbi:ABC-F family ATP-binding cassette domain-containing protein [Nocardia sp. NPDC048505]|uniref:ABC-F family ATP-binding cassette domain-containing protein n=1 Tax=unclassified Nocardia TaxID=2637762 RepID=UPI003400C34E